MGPGFWKLLCGGRGERRPALMAPRLAQRTPEKRWSSQQGCPGIQAGSFVCAGTGEGGLLLCSPVRPRYCYPKASSSAPQLGPGGL